MQRNVGVLVELVEIEFTGSNLKVLHVDAMRRPNEDGVGKQLCVVALVVCVHAWKEELSYM